jgi:hypothetical protein
MPYVINRIVGSTVNFQYIHAGTGADGTAIITDSAGTFFKAFIGIFGTVKRTRKNSGSAGFSAPSWSGEKISMGYMPTFK